MPKHWIEGKQTRQKLLTLITRQVLAKVLRRKRSYQNQAGNESYHGLLSLDGLDLQTFILFRGNMVVLPLVRVASQGQLPGRPSLAVGSRLAGWWRRARVISTLLLGDVRFRPVNRLDMLTERAGVCVAFGAAWDFADVGFLKNNRKKNNSKIMCAQGENMTLIKGMILSVPHLNVCGSGAWLGLRRWRRPCCSLHVHTHRASLQCESASES